MTDWRQWHDEYADSASPLSRRLVVVQGAIVEWLAPVRAGADPPNV